MKHIIILAIATVAAVSLSSCASKKESQTQATYQETAPTYGYSK